MAFYASRSPHPPSRLKWRWVPRTRPGSNARVALSAPLGRLLEPGELRLREKDHANVTVTSTCYLRLWAVAEHARAAARTGRRPQGPAASRRMSGTALRCRLVSFRTPHADRQARKASCTSSGGPPGAPEPARTQGGRRRRPPASGPSYFGLFRFIELAGWGNSPITERTPPLNPQSAFSTVFDLWN